MSGRQRPTYACGVEASRVSLVVFGFLDVGISSLNSKIVFSGLSPTDANHQEQDFDTCGHILTKAECDAYADDYELVAGTATSTQVDGTDKPYGCYKIPADDNAGIARSFVFNGNSASTEECSSTNPCVCKYKEIN